MESEVSSEKQSSSSSKSGTGSWCSVCGDYASGFHYGVDSCEGCKGFFRRCIIQGLTQQCSNSEKCDITPMTRNSCQYCRLKKCFAVGMSRGASRLGRRPKRLKNTMFSEADCLKPAKLVKPVDIAPQLPRLEELPLSTAEIEVLLDKLNMQNQCSIKLPSLLVALGSLLEKGYHNASDTVLSASASGDCEVIANSNDNESSKTRRLSPDSTAGSADTSHSPYSQHYQVKTEDNTTIATTSVTEQPESGNCQVASKCDAEALVRTVYRQLREAEQQCKMASSLPPLLPANMTIITDAMPDCHLVDDQALLELAAEARQIPTTDSEREALVEQVIQSVVEAHLSTCSYTREVVEAGLQRYRQRQRQQSATAKSESGPDPMHIWSQFVSNMAPVIQRVVAFSKSLPGFSELCQDDQIKLIKQGSFEVILARYVPLFTDDGMFVPDMSVKVPRHIVQEMPLGDFFDEQYTFALKMNSLCLSDAELGLLNAIMIMNPGRSGLSNHRAVHKLRGLLLQCLYVLIKSHHSDTCDERFSRMVNILPLSDRINQMHSQTLSNLKLSSPDIQFPDLHMEVYDGQP